MAELLAQLAGLVVIAFWWAVTIHAAIAGSRPPRPGRGPKWGSFGPL